MTRLLYPLLVASLAAWTSASAQTLELRASNSASPAPRVGVGDTIRVDVWARLDCLAVSGIDLHLSLPLDVFRVVDTAPRALGLQPFAQGTLLCRAVVAYNGISNPQGAAVDDRLHLRYAAVMPPGSDRGVKGQGCVASFAIVAKTHLDQAELLIEDNPILETRLVLPDGHTERRFVALEGIKVSASHLATVARERSWAQVKQFSGN